MFDVLQNLILIQLTIIKLRLHKLWKIFWKKVGRHLNANQTIFLCSTAENVSHGVH